MRLIPFLSYVNVPIPGRTIVLSVALAFVLLFGTAIIIEVVRRRRSLRAITTEAWKSVNAIMEDKDFNDEETSVFRGVLQRRAPEAPHHAVTLRSAFDSCVEAEMEAVDKAGDAGRYAALGATLRDIRTKLGLDFVALGQRIHSTRELYRTQDLWISPASVEPTQWVRAHVAMVNEAFFAVSPAPAEGETIPPFRDGERAKCRLWREEDARYMFTVRFSHSERDPHLLYFYHTSDMRRVQNRQYFRIGYDQVVDAGILGTYAEDGLEEGGGKRIVQKVRGRIVNISAGGCAIIFPQEIAVPHVIRLPMELDGAEPFNIDGQIVSTVPLAGGRFLIRTTFMHVDDETRDRLAQFVIRRQQRVLEQAEKSVT